VTAVRLVTAAAMVAAAALPATATTIVVNHDGTGQFETIQEGIDAASEGDTVRVMPGTYTGSLNTNLAFGAKNIVLRGNPADPSETIVDCQHLSGNRAIKLVGTGQDTTSVVDGFTIKRGRVVGPSEPGAGIRCWQTSPKLLNLVITDNVAEFGSAGGGIYCGNSSPVIRNVTFSVNSSDNGAGLYCATFSSPKLRNVSFADNVAGNRGGAIYCGTGSDPTLAGVAIVGNTAGNEGGGLYCFQSSPTLTRVTFLRNVATQSGGGVFCGDDSGPSLTNVTFALNEAADTGGIYLTDNCDPTISNTIIAYSTGGAMSCQFDSDPVVTHCYSHENDGDDDLCSARPDNVIGVDPVFCDIGNDDVTLASTSPCLADGNEWEELVGAHGQGCSEPAVEPASWGRIKAFYR